jgi:four helix bundle protein
MERLGEWAMGRGSDWETGRMEKKSKDGMERMEKIRTHRDLRVFQSSFAAGMDIFRVSKSFPKEEVYSLTDQIRRSSRSVSGNIAEAFRKRRYPKAFVAKLSDAEGEAAETQVWLDYAHACDYIDPEEYAALNEKYDHILAMLVNMSNKPENWSC